MGFSGLYVSQSQALLVCISAKLMAILAEGDILASSIDKPPKLWIHHGKDRDGEDPKMLSVRSYPHALLVYVVFGFF